MALPTPIVKVLLLATLVQGCSAKIGVKYDKKSSGDDKTITVDEVSMVNNEKAADFPVSGSCSVEGENNIVVEATDGQTSTPPVQASCINGVWNARIDLSLLADGAGNIQISAGYPELGAFASATSSKDTEVLLSIEAVPDIVQENSYGYPVQGTCEVDAADAVILNANDGKNSIPTVKTDCTDGKWSAKLNVSSLDSGKDHITVTAAHIDAAANSDSKSDKASKKGFPPLFADLPAQTFVVGIAITEVKFVNTGAIVVACESFPALPNGLTIAVSGNTCAINGTPTLASSAKNYVIKGTATDKSNDSTQLKITVLPPNPPVLADAPARIFTKGVTIPAVTFVNSGQAVAACTVAPALPLGLFIAVAGGTCEITGTPNVATPATDYTVTGLAADNSSGTASISIRVNSLPVASASTVSATEDVQYVFTAANFGYTDEDGDSLGAVKITSLETLGSLKVSGVDVSLNQIISRASIDAGDLTFDTGVPGAFGANYSTFEFSVSDGLMESIASATMSIDVVSANDEPTAANNTVSAVEDVDFVFTAAHFNYTDSEGDPFTSVKITTLESVGALKLSGVDVTLNQVIAKSAIDSGFLTFISAPNGFGVAHDSFGFNVNDGTSDSVAAYTMTIDVSAVNDAPTAANKTVTAAEGVQYTFNASDFNYNDVDSDALSSIKITSLETVGALKLSGTDVTLNQVIPAASIANLTFDAALPTDNGPGYDNFGFSVNDGTVDSVASYTVTIDISPVNNAPTAANSSVSATEDVQYVFSAADFSYADTDGNVMASVKITTVESVGALKLNGVDVFPNQVITKADIDSSLLTFDTAAAHDNGFAYDSFTFSVNDGALDSVSTYTMTVNVTPVNDAPTAANSTVTATEDVQFTFVAADFSYSDVETDPLASIKITTLESVGSLKLSGTDVTLNQVIPAASIGNLTFDTAAANANGVGYDSFGFSVNDGALDSVASYTMTIDVTAVNDVPTAANNTVEATEGVQFAFAAGDFGYTDVDSDPLASIKITTLESVGSLKLSGSDVTLNQVIPAASIANLTFDAASPTDNGDGYDSFQFSVNDGTADSAGSYTITIDVNPVNNAPTAANNTVTATEDVQFTFAAGDFNYSDVDSDPLASVKITTLESAGALKLSGADVTLNQVIPAASLANLTFDTAALNDNGLAYATFGFSVNDGTADSAGSYTMTIDVTAANDAPTAANNTVTATEDVQFSFAAGDFNYSDVETDPLASVKITTLESAGALKLSGSDVTLNQVIPAASIANLTFDTAALNDNGLAYATFGFSVNDGTVDSGSSYTMTIDVTAANDAPTAANNTVTATEDVQFTFASGDFNYSDVDTDPLASIKITTLESTGALKLSGSDVTLNQVIPAASIANLTFDTAALNDNGLAYATFGFSVNDGTADSAGSYTMTIDVTAANDAPTAANNTVTATEDVQFTFAAGDFNYSDTDSDPLASVKITTLESAGALKLSGSDVTLNQVIPAASIANLTFDTAALHDNGLAYATFGFSVNDGTADSAGSYTMTVDVTAVNDVPTAANNTVEATEGVQFAFAAGDFGYTDVDSDPLASIKITSLETVGALKLSGSDVTLNQVIPAASIANLTFDAASPTDNGDGYDSFQFSVNDGTADSAGSYTITIDVNPVNNAPTAANNTVTATEDVQFTFAAGDFNYSDVDSDPLASVKITTLESAGALKLSGADVTLNQVIAAASIANLTFDTAALNDNGLAYATFGFSVNDGTADSAGSYTMTIDVTAANDAPTAANNTVTATEDVQFSFAAGDFNYSDVETDPLASVKITTLESAGALKLSGSDVTLNQVIPAASIANLTFDTAALHDNGLAYATFGFSVNDGTVDSGSSYTMTIDVTAANDAPTAANNTVTATEDVQFTFASGDFNYADVDSDPLASVKITTLESAGALKLSGSDVTLNQVIPAASIANLTFDTAALNDNGLAYATFGFSVNDGTVDSGSSYTMTIDVTAANDAPTAANNTVTATEDVQFTFAAGDFNYSDVDSDPLASVKITTLESAGALKLSGSDVTLNQVIPAASIANLTFDTAALHDNGLAYATFGFSVNDGTADSAGSYTMTVDVNAVNDVPTAANNTVEATEGVQFAFAAGDFGYTDVDSDPLASIKITSLETVGALKLSGSDVTLNQVIPAASIANLTFDAASPTDNGDGYDSFQFSVNDGTADSAGSYTITIDVNPVNNAPTAANNTVTATEDVQFTFAAGDFNYSDADSDPLASVKITTLESAGALKLSGSDVTLNQVIPAASIANLTFDTTALNDNGLAYATFGFSVNDGTADSAGSYTMTIDVTAANDAPTAANNTVTATEDVQFSFAAGDFNYSDVETDPLASVKITTLESAGALKLSGSDVTLNQVIPAASIANLTFDTAALNDNGLAYATFGFSVNDGTVDSGSSYTMTIDVTAANDAPTAANNTVTATEDVQFSFAAGDFNYSDVDTDPLASIKITTLESTGALKLSGSDVTLNQVIPAASIASLTFDTAALNDNGLAYATFGFSVNDGTVDSGSSYTLTIDVTAANDAPTAANNTVTATEDVQFTFAAGDFNYSDTDSDPLASVKITTLESAGALKLSGSDVTLNQVIPAASIANLTFDTAALHDNGLAYATFGFSVNDGTADSAGSYTMTIDVTAANDAPTAANNTVTATEDVQFTFAAGDFNYTDVDSDPLASVKITTLESTGALKLSGSDVTLNQVIPAASIANLTFDTAALNDNGLAYATFGFSVNDGTVDSGSSYTMTIDVTAANDAPTAANNTVTATEDVQFSFASGDFNYADVDSDALASIKITTLESTGALKLSGSDVTLNQVIPAASIANLTFDTAALNDNGLAYATFGFSVNDGTVDSGSSYTMTIDVTAANDAPTAANNTVTATEDVQFSFAAGDFNYSDVETDPLASIKITTLESTGALKLSGSDVTLNQVIPAASIANLTFDTAALNDNGLAYATFGFSVNDGTVDSGSSYTMTIDVTAANDAPTAANNTVTATEDVQFSFASGDFNYADVDSDALASIKITTLESTGALKLSGSDVTLNQVIPAASIANLTFDTAALNDNGLAYATFGFSVNDGTADSGSSYTMTIDVTAANDAPTAANNTVTATEDVQFTFAAGDFNYSDTDSDPLASVKITTLESAGALKLSGSDVTLNQVISVASIANLTFDTAALNDNGLAYATFGFSVNDGTVDSGSSYTMTIDVIAADDAPTAANNTVTATEDVQFTFAAGDFNYSDVDSDPLSSIKITTLESTGALKLSGSDVTLNQVIPAASIANLTFDTAALHDNGSAYATFGFSVNDGTTDSAGSYTMTIDVTAANDAPTASNTSVSFDEDTTYTFTSANFSYVDVDLDAMASVKITSLETVGVLEYNGSNVVPNQVITVADIALGYLTFDTAALNDNGFAYDSFEFSVNDGTVDSAGSYTMTVHVNAINDAPTASNNTVTATEDVQFTFGAADFNYADTEGNPLTSIKITTLESAGALKLSGSDVTINQVIPAASIANLTFDTAALHDNGSAYATLGFSVNDGIIDSAGSYTMTIDVTAVNDAPTAANNTVTATEDVQFSFAAGDFNYSDVDSDALASVKITTLESAGALKLSGSDVTLNQVIPAASIANLTFDTAALNDNGLAYATFGFSVNDGTVDSGSSYTMTIDVTAANDAPTAANNTVTATEDVQFTFAAGDFNYSDTDSDPLASVKITTLESTGALKLSGSDVTLNQVIPAASIGNLTFDTAALHDNGLAYATFGFSVNDGTADSAGSYTMTVDVTAVNDAPTAANNTVTATEDVQFTFAAGDFNYSDVDSDPLVSVKITTLESTGALKLSGSDVTLNQVIPAASIANLTFDTAALNDNGLAYATFGFSVNDGTVDSGSSYTLTIDVTAANDAPTAANNTVTATEDVQFSFASGDFNYADVDSDALASIKITTLESTGALKLSGSDVTLNQVIPAASIANLTFDTAALNDNGLAYATFGFSVYDGTADSAGSYTMTIDVTAVNDAPTWAATIGDFSLQESVAISGKTANATDVDAGQSLTYSLDTANMTCDDGSWTIAPAINPGSGALSGTPSATDVGSCTIKVVATDDGAGTLSVSETFTVTVTPAPPAAPTGVAATVDTSTEIDIAWNASAGATSYDLYYSTTTGVTSGNGTLVAGVTSPYTHIGRTDGQAYFYIIVAKNAGGSSADSSETSATSLAAPTSPSAVAGNTQVTVSWTAVTGATGYDLYWNNAGAVTTADNKITGVTSPYIHTPLSNGTPYYYRIEAKNAGGTGNLSTEVNATPSASGSATLVLEGQSPGVFSGSNGSTDGTTISYVVRNTGTASATFTQKSVSTGDSTHWSLLLDDCSTALAAGDTCTLTYKFAPTTSGAKTTTLTVSASGTSDSVTFNGTVNSLPAWTVQGDLSITSGWDVDGTGTPASKSLRSILIINDTGADITGFDTSIGAGCAKVSRNTADEPFGVGTDCGANTTVAAGSRCYVTVELSVTTTAANQSCSLSFVRTSGHTLPASVPITATAIASAKYEVHAISASLGTVNAGATGSSTAEIKICRASGGNPGFSGFAALPTGFTWVGGDKYGTTKPVTGSTCTNGAGTNILRFDPTAGMTGFIQESVTMTGDAGEVFVLTMEGYAVGSAVASFVGDSSPYDFEYIKALGITGKAYKTFTVKNTGTKDIGTFQTVITTVPSSAGTYTVETDNCPGSLPVGASCDITVSAYKAAPGSDDDADGTNVVSLEIRDNGTPVGAMQLTARFFTPDPYLVVKVDEDSTYRCDTFASCTGANAADFGASNMDTPVIRTFRIKNWGVDEATSLRWLLTGTDIDDNPAAPTAPNCDRDGGAAEVFCYYVTGSTCTWDGTLAPGAECTVKIQFDGDNADAPGPATYSDATVGWEAVGFTANSMGLTGTLMNKEEGTQKFKSTFNGGTGAENDSANIVAFDSKNSRVYVGGTIWDSTNSQYVWHIAAYKAYDEAGGASFTLDSGFNSGGTMTIDPNGTSNKETNDTYTKLRGLDVDPTTGDIFVCGSFCTTGTCATSGNSQVLLYRYGETGGAAEASAVVTTNSATTTASACFGLQFSEEGATDYVYVAAKRSTGASTADLIVSRYDAQSDFSSPSSETAGVTGVNLLTGTDNFGSDRVKVGASHLFVAYAISGPTYHVRKFDRTNIAAGGTTTNVTPAGAGTWDTISLAVGTMSNAIEYLWILTGKDGVVQSFRTDTMAANTTIGCGGKDLNDSLTPIFGLGYTGVTAFTAIDFVQNGSATSIYVAGSSQIDAGVDYNGFLTQFDMTTTTCAQDTVKWGENFDYDGGTASGENTLIFDIDVSSDLDPYIVGRQTFSSGDTRTAFTAKWLGESP